MFDQFENGFRNTSIESQPMNVPLESHFPQNNFMNPPVDGDQMGARRAGNQLLNHVRPLLSGNGLFSQQVRKDRLVGKFGRKQRRKNQVVFVIFQRRKPLGKKRTNAILIDLIVAAQVIGNLGRHVAWTFQLESESFNESRHRVSM